MLPPAVRRALANVLALAGAFALVGVAVALLGAGGRGRPWGAAAALLGVTAAIWWLAFRLNRPPRSRGAATGRVVLYEAPMPGVTLSGTPALTVRGARDAVERFIPLEEFEALFGGWALWAAPARPTDEMPGEALGVWRRRTCKRFRRVLRERGATVVVRREPGPAQRPRQFVTRPRPGR
jgi:hypothetical protein